MEALHKIALLLTLVVVVFLFSCSKKAPPVDCDINKGACTRAIGKGRLSFEITPRPVRTMRRLLFRVRLTDIDYNQDRIKLFLEMPGMDMGENLVSLKRIRKGVYEGAGVIVRCPSGKTLWRANVILDEFGKVSFTFDLGSKG